MLTKRSKIITVVLMVVLGTCMHFVHEHLHEGVFATILGSIFPINETSWEHMKMIWYPFLAAGIILSIKTKNSGYFAGFVISAIGAMMVQLGAFATYQSFTETSVLIFDILIYTFSMIVFILLAFDLAQKQWAQKNLVVWIILAVAVTAGIVYLTYCPGEGYVFLDNEGLHDHEHGHSH